MPDEKVTENLPEKMPDGKQSDKKLSYLIGFGICGLVIVLMANGAVSVPVGLVICIVSLATIRWG